MDPYVSNGLYYAIHLGIAWPPGLVDTLSHRGLIPRAFSLEERDPCSDQGSINGFWYGYYSNITSR